jgi:hypothetical protein
MEVDVLTIKEDRQCALRPVFLYCCLAEGLTEQQFT